MNQKKAFILREIVISLLTLGLSYLLIGFLPNIYDPLEHDYGYSILIWTFIIIFSNEFVYFILMIFKRIYRFYDLVPSCITYVAIIIFCLFETNENETFLFLEVSMLIGIPSVGNIIYFIIKLIKEKNTLSVEIDKKFYGYDIKTIINAQKIIDILKQIPVINYNELKKETEFSSYELFYILTVLKNRKNIKYNKVDKTYCLNDKINKN